MTNVLFETLQETIKAYMTADQQSYIKEVYDFAKTAHKDQKRQSGKDYITHPLEVAIILSEIKQDVSTVAAGLLHDTLEDTAVTKERIADIFGEDTAHLVEGVTKLGKVYFGSTEEAEAENYRKLFLAMAEDLRVVIIKLADRLHNMRTLKYLASEKQRRISRETMDIFAPLSLRLGMAHLRWELEDLAFSYLDPEGFQEVRGLVDGKREARENFIEAFAQKVRKVLEAAKIEAKVSGRPKHFYSIHQKMTQANISFDELYDLLGVRIIVPSISHCYEVLGTVHSNFKPVSGRFKDYIALPKSNWYQSLHTTVIAMEGKPVEVQIRTEEMNQIAEYGIAVHWRYKEDSEKDGFKVDFDWLRQILEDSQEDAQEYLHDLKIDLFADEVFVFTPKGDVQVLQAGATVIDFAFKIHTEVGLRCIGATVNGGIVPLSYCLENGDRIDIRTGSIEAPKSGWLEYAESRHAKSTIKAWFRKQKADANKEKGEEELEKYLADHGLSLKEALKDKALDDFIEKNRLKSLEDLFLMIAYGDISLRSILSYLAPTEAKEKMSTQKVTTKSSQRRKRGVRSPVRVMGEEFIESYLAKCCNPLPGDEIIGFVTLGHGVSVHRVGCTNIMTLSEENKERIIEVEWQENTRYLSCPVALNVEAFERPDLMTDIVRKILNTSHNLLEMTSHPLKGSQVLVKLQLELESLSYLSQVKELIMEVKDVLSVYRPR